MIVQSVQDINSQPLFFKLEDFIKSTDVYIKFEGLNIAHSVKLKTARFLIKSIQDRIIPGKTKIIESSSGNLAIALSIICKELGVDFICVTDPNVAEYSETIIKIYGGEIIKVTERDENGGYLQTRIKTIHALLESSEDYIWTNQYANQANCDAHYCETAKEILNEFSNVDYLFIGAGTTGTMVGCARYFKKYSPSTTIVAVDAEGSVTFGYAAKKRYIPGLGTSRKPEICDPSIIDGLVIVPEVATIKMCHQMLDKYSLLLGGSSGSVLAGVQQFSQFIKPEATVIAISPDFGEKYIPSVYDQNWVREKFGNIL